jgi:glutathione synthase/RimK-type ligase-like ATP-grasp enzyme
VRPIGVIYENESWLAPVFAALDAAGAAYERLYAVEAAFDPTDPAPDWSCAVNKVSPSSYLRGHAAAIPFAESFLPFLEARGVPVVNGSAAFRLETSKVRQLLLLHSLGISAPRGRVVTDRARIAEAAAGLRFPVIVKPNVGGSGALMLRFDDVDALRAGAAAVDLGPDGSGLVQEYLEPADGAIVRIEFLDGEFLYAIRITNDRAHDDFNLCPADICQVPATSEFENNPMDAPAKKPLRIEAFDPPGEMIDAVLRIATAGKLDVGGVEYLVAGRDGRPYVYDINALSNFVTDAPALVGFDPHERFARWLVRRAQTPERIFEEVR